MKSKNFIFYTFCVFILGISITMILRNEQIKAKTPYLDLPKEWNEHTISEDRAHPTELMAVYDPIKQKYIIEFIDK
jgi:hypothetical protein